MWVFKIDGQTYGVHHASFHNVSFETKETPDNPHTKGSLKIKRATVEIWQENDIIRATVTQNH
jgi:hypothetical protein